MHKQSDLPTVNISSQSPDKRNLATTVSLLLIWSGSYLLLMVGTYQFVAQYVPGAAQTINIHNPLRYGWLVGAAIALVGAPIAETLWTQIIPFEACRWAQIHPQLASLLSGVFFSVGHSGQGTPKMVATFVCGMLLAEAYNRNRGNDWMSGYAFAAYIHAIFNAIVLAAVASSQ